LRADVVPGPSTCSDRRHRCQRRPGGAAPAGAAPERHLFLMADSVALDAAELAWAHRHEIGPLAVVAARGAGGPVRLADTRMT
jgi:hypothetical protein